MTQSSARTDGSSAKQFLFAIACRLSCVLLLMGGASAWAEIRVTDDTGSEVVLSQPAQRIVSLAPHVTEMLFSAGAGDQVVGVVSYSTYPPEATRLPVVGSYKRMDLEAVIALQPDLVVGWETGNPEAALRRLKTMGIPLYITEPRTLEQIPSNLERLGLLSGTQSDAVAAAERFRQRLDRLRETYRDRQPVSVFYQVWDRPLMTINGHHLINQLISLCGGVNVFAHLPAIAPTISREAVLATNPQVIVASGMGQERPIWLEQWREWPGLQAVKRNHLFFVPPDLLQRQTVRVMDGAERLCRQFQQARTEQQQ